MNLRRLEYFTVLARSGSMAKAAELLRISPPALSKAMKVLEEELEISLWTRDGRRMILTDAGQRLLKRAPDLVASLSELKDSLHAPRSDRETLRLGTFETFSTYFLGFFRGKEWAGSSLELHELLPGQVEKHLAEGSIDLGITYLPIPDPRLDFIRIASIEMGVFARKGAFPGVGQPELPFVTPIMPLQGIPTKVRGLDGWPDDAYQRKVLHQVTLMESAMELCRQGLAAGYFPAFIVEAHNRRVAPEYRLERRRSPFNHRVCRSDVYLVKRKSTEETPLVRRLAKALRTLR